ncbi:hypothetical protein Salat_0663500 [Sesamum alatum]|uniref:Uncharacterized protein n=1 Tax=Sesamum alatum TaxID=300844 RepID=A0AAE2CUI6_9LAMI|nr:hypothetical protein Salat_0663500 [Sesamum alatum]
MATPTSLSDKEPQISSSSPNQTSSTLPPLPKPLRPIPRVTSAPLPPSPPSAMPSDHLEPYRNQAGLPLESYKQKLTGQSKHVYFPTWLQDWSNLPSVEGPPDSPIGNLPQSFIIFPPTELNHLDQPW